MEVNDLLAAAEMIKNENSINKNSSNRIGVMLENMINFFSTNISPAAAALIQEAVSKSTTGVRKGMSVVWSGAIAEIPTGYVLSNGNNGQPINGVIVPDCRSRFLIGYDSSKPALPANAIDATENYGKAGNIGGKGSVLLTGAQSGTSAHKHNYKQTSRSTVGGHSYDNNHHAVGGGGSTEFTYVTENSTEANATASHENRPPYYVVYWITKVSDDTTAEYNSAYQSYKDTTADVPVKTEAEWVASLNGTGQSAYEASGFVGTEAEWIVSLKGTAGKSAYQLALDGGYIGSEAQWVASLNGYTPQKGTDYFDGDDGYTPVKGVDYADGAPGINAPVTMAIYQIGANGMALPRKLPAYPYDRIISAVRLSSDCSGLSAKIGATDYNHITLVDVTIPANVELIINYLTVSAGNDSADALIIF